MSKYEVGDKATIEILGKSMTEYIVEDYTRKRIYFDTKSLDGISEPLSTYTEPLEAKIRRQAAEITRLLAENKELKERVRKANKISFNGGRLAGQNEAWELARKITCQPINGGFKRSEFEEIFDYDYISDIYKKYTYSEAAAKVAQWEKAKEEIKVGDVYKSLSGNFVVCGIDREKDMVKALWDDLSVGKIYLYEIKEQYTKTGRHIDIDSFLKQIGEE